MSGKGRFTRSINLISQAAAGAAVDKETQDQRELRVRPRLLPAKVKLPPPPSYRTVQKLAAGAERGQPNMPYTRICTVCTYIRI